MIKVKKDMTGWVMSEHGVPNSRLTVIKQVEDHVQPNGKRRVQYLCKCNCSEDKYIIVTAGNISNGHTLSCGCLTQERLDNQIEDLTGRKFGRLTVLERGEDYITPGTQKKYPRWLCECSCPDHNRVLVIGKSLRNGKSQSCGCLQKEIASKTSKKYNQYDLSGEYGIGWTSNTNKEFYFDLDDYDKIKDICWIESGNGATRTLTGRDPKTGANVSMHQYLGFKKYDHIDRNELNNRKNNLRICTHQENCFNKSLPSNNTSGVIGVVWDKERKKWAAQIGLNEKCIHLGRYDNKESAIKARLEAEIQYYGEFAPQQHLFQQYNIQQMVGDLQ